MLDNCATSKYFFLGLNEHWLSWKSLTLLLLNNQDNDKISLADETSLKLNHQYYNLNEGAFGFLKWNDFLCASYSFIILNQKFGNFPFLLTNVFCLKINIWNKQTKGRFNYINKFLFFQMNGQSVQIFQDKTYVKRAFSFFFFFLEWISKKVKVDKPKFECSIFFCKKKQEKGSLSERNFWLC